MITKALLFCSAVAVVQASAILSKQYLNTGVSSSSRQEDANGNYALAYDIKDGLGATNSRSEVGDAHGNKKGSYTLADIDGRARRVEYVADGHGFRAVVKTNEPRTAASAPASALVDSPYAGPAASVVNHAAPVAAPIVAAAPAIIGHAAASLAVSAPVISAPAIAAPVAYGDVLGYEDGLGYGAIIGNNLGFDLGVEKAISY